MYHINILITCLSAKQLSQISLMSKININGEIEPYVNISDVINSIFFLPENLDSSQNIQCKY